MSSTDKPQKPADQGGAEDKRSVDEDQLPQVSLTISEDHMQVLLSCAYKGTDLTPLALAIENGLEHLSAMIPKRDDLLAILQKANAGAGPITDLEIVKGQIPIPPIDGRIDWDRDFFSEEFVVDEKTGAADYRQRKGNPNIEEGEKIATAYMPQEGTPGHDIFGKPLLMPKAKAVQLRAGERVRSVVIEGGEEFYACASGRLQRQGNSLSIDQVYTINGSVGLETGDIIDHPGTVVIRGDILSGSQVIANKDIEVHGNVEGANVHAGGSITIHGGVLSSQEYRMTAGGSIRVRFAQDADFEAEGDLTVNTSLVHCDIRVRGKIAMENGKVIGGSCVALRGISVAEAGGSGMVPTLLIAGVDHLLEGRLLPLQKRLTAAMSKRKQIDDALLPLLKHRDRLTDMQRDAMKTLATKRQEFDAVITQLNAEITMIREASDALAVPKIHIRDRLYPEVMLKLREAQLEMKETFDGPLTATMDGDHVRLRGGGGSTVSGPSGSDGDSE